MNLRLLNGTETSTWNKDLPIRLRKMYSHWISFDGKVIVLRNINYKEKSISFILINNIDKW